MPGISAGRAVEKIVIRSVSFTEKRIVTHFTHNIHFIEKEEIIKIIDLFFS